MDLEPKEARTMGTGGYPAGPVGCFRLLEGRETQALSPLPRLPSCLTWVPGSDGLAGFPGSGAAAGGWVLREEAASPQARVRRPRRQVPFACAAAQGLNPHSGGLQGRTTSLESP